MSEPQKLRHRIAMAFAAPENPSPPARIDEPSPQFDRSPLPNRDKWISKEGGAGRRALQVGSALAGLAAAAFVMSFGASAVSMVVALALCAAGFSPMLHSLVARRTGRREIADGDAGGADALRSAAPAAESSHAAAGAMLDTIHDALGDMALCRSMDGVILSANNTFRKVARCDRPEGRTCEELEIRLTPNDGEHRYEVQFVTDEGLRTYLWHDIVTPDPLLGVSVIRSLARDVTAERRDSQIREQARARAERESSIKSQLIATVSHEIRTPLSGLLGMGQLLAGTGLSPVQKNYLDGISQSGTALVQLVEDLLDFSTLAAGRFQLRPRKEAIRPLIESVVELLSSRAHAKGIEIGATISSDLPELLVIDPARFRQVLYNVIGNAVKFTETGGVLVSASLDRNILVIQVKDTGPGMDASEMQRIFGEFEQGEISRAREGGVGLGLAISARIVAEAGGMLTVESAVGEGSTFIVRMPVSIDSIAMRLGNELQSLKVLLLAPAGPAAIALATTLKGLGAETHVAVDVAEAEAILDRLDHFTGIIVDHRLDAGFTVNLSHDPRLAGARRVYLVNPESRPAQMSGSDYDSWLIRPLREQSLIDVLTGKLKGLEHRAAASEEFPMLAAEEQEDERLGARTEAGLSILVGEDDPVNAMISQAILEKAGHIVRLAPNFARLADILADQPVDIILTDYSMPDGTCDGFISRLRDIERSTDSKPLPVIVLTADNSDETRRKLLMNGADLVLLKPASPDMLQGAIARLGERLIRAA